MAEEQEKRTAGSSSTPETVNSEGKAEKKTIRRRAKAQTESEKETGRGRSTGRAGSVRSSSRTRRKQAVTEESEVRPEGAETADSEENRTPEHTAARRRTVKRENGKEEKASSEQGSVSGTEVSESAPQQETKAGETTEVKVRRKPTVHLGSAARSSAGRTRQKDHLTRSTGRTRQRNTESKSVTAGDSRVRTDHSEIPSINEYSPERMPSEEGTGISAGSMPEMEERAEPRTETRADVRTDAGKISDPTVLRDPEAQKCQGILEIMPENFGFIRALNFTPSEQDVYVNPAMIKRYNLKTGDSIIGAGRKRNPMDHFAALMYIESVNGLSLQEREKLPDFDKLTPIFPNKRLHLTTDNGTAPLSLRVLDLISPVGKGQRGMIVSPPKAGKTTLLKAVAKAIVKNEPDMHLIILLIDERPEEVTDMKEEVEGGNVSVVYSTFDELPEHHKKVAEMTIERAKRLVERGEDVTILLDSITRLARAYNLVVPPSGRTLSGGLDPAALHMPKRFFGAARNMREGGSLTILATALVDTGSRMDDVIYEEFKGTGNMELVLNRELQERRIFPAIDVLKSSTRRDDLLLTPLERSALDTIHKMTSDDKKDSVENLLRLFAASKDNNELCNYLVNGIPLSGKTGWTQSRPGTGVVVKVNKR